MRNRFFYFSSLFLLLFLFGHTLSLMAEEASLDINSSSVLAEESERDSPVEMFVAGQQFGSMKRYRVERVQRFVEEVLPKFDEDSYSLFVDVLFREFSVEKFSDFSEEELKIIVREVFSRGVILKEKAEKEEESAVLEMEAMVDLYKRQRGIKTPTHIDIRSMKTIDIGK